MRHLNLQFVIEHHFVGNSMSQVGYETVTANVESPPQNHGRYRPVIFY